MKLTTRIASILMLLVLFCTAHEATAQKKLKGLAKQVVGKWILDNMAFDIDASKLDDAKKAEFESAKPMLAMLGEQMKGKVSFDFKADGTFESQSTMDNEAGEKSNGTWKVEGNKLIMDETKDGVTDSKAFDVSLVKNVLSLGMQKDGEPMKIQMKFGRAK